MHPVFRYLESDGKGQPYRPWLWIIWLFFGPMIQSICYQLYIFIATRVLVITEVIITQLVFEHSLRIRFKAETSSKSESRSASRTPSRPDTPDSQAHGASPDSEVSSLAESAREPSGSVSEASTVAVREPSTSTTASTLKGTVKKQKTTEISKEEPQKGGGNLVGKINNLVTSDLNNITSARDFGFLG